ncbi:MAG: FtsX-like permease family protein [Terriglobia bacterium]|jgi:putative ABC transport system permease protein
MSLARLVLRNAVRNRRRSLLTAASVAVSIALLIIFLAAYRFLESPPASTTERSHLVLVVMASASPLQPMPVSYRSRIERLEGVRAVTQVFWFDARYRNENTMIATFGLDPQILFTFFPNWQLSPLEKEQFMHEKVAAIAGRSTANKYGWKVGDHIHVSSPAYFGVGVDLILRGIYDSNEEQSYLVFHWDYLNDVLGSPNVTDLFWILANSADDMPSLMKTVDAQFREETVQTRTQTVKQVVLNFISWLGNVRLILVSISGAVVFAVLLTVANTMAMSIRERTTELAVLRALGFSTNTLLTVLTAESLVISLVGASCGCVAAWLICRAVAGYALGGGLLLVNLEIGLTGGLSALGVAILTSLLSTLVPAYRASRMSIAEALRYTG